VAAEGFPRGNPAEPIPLKAGREPDFVAALRPLSRYSHSEMNYPT